MSESIQAGLLFALSAILVSGGLAVAQESEPSRDPPTGGRATAAPAILVLGASPSPSEAPRSVTLEQDGLRVTMTLERAPLQAGVPTWLTSTVENTGADTVSFAHDSCRTIVQVEGELQGVEWEAAGSDVPADPPGLMYYAQEFWSGQPGPIRIDFVPRRQLERSGPDALPQESACADMGLATRLAPGKSLRQRARWSGSAEDRLGPPPSAPVRIVGLIHSYRRASDPGDDWKSLEVALETQVVDGRDADMLDPMEVVEAAFTDEGFRAFIESTDPEGSSWVIWYDDETAIWEVGAFVSDSATFEVAQVDPRTGAVLGYVERPKRS